MFPPRSALTCLVFLGLMSPLPANQSQPATLPASKPATASRPEDQSRIVATILGRSILAGDLEPSEKERNLMAARMSGAEFDGWLMKYRGNRLSSKITAPLWRQFIRERHLEPTPAELKEAADQIRRKMKDRQDTESAEATRLRAQLASTTIDTAERAKLTARLEQLEKSVAGDEKMRVQREAGRPELLDRLAKTVAERKALQGQVQSRPAASENQQGLLDRIETLDNQIQMLEMMSKDLPEMMAQWMLGPWKANRELYRQYGGTVIWQQAGIEAVGARRKWLEEHEKAGRFTINDPAYREEFYRYFVRQDHPFQIEKSDPFDRPPWEEEPASRPRP